MKATVSIDFYENAHVKVTLSERNLLSLLHKLEMEESKRTLVRVCEDGTVLTVVAELDEDHYEGREPGKMHPLTEEFIEGFDVGVGPEVIPPA